MSQPTAFTVAVASDVPPAERDLLVRALESGAQVQTSTTRAIDPATIATFVVVVGAVKVTAEAVKASAEAGTALMELAEKIRAWRDVARKRGSTPNVQLQHPAQPSLDLRTATDEQVLAWLLHIPTP